MFVPDGLTGPQFRALQTRLRVPHFCTITAKLLDLEDKHVLNLPPVVGGEVDRFDPGVVTTVTVADPERTLVNFQGAQASHYMVKVFYTVGMDDPDLPIVTWPVSTFVVDQATRDDTLLTFTGRSKVALAQFQPEEPFTVKAGVKITEAIKRLMEQAGESRALMNIPDNDRVLRFDYTVAPVHDGDPETNPRTFMVGARQLASRMGMVLFYRPDGSLICKKASAEPVFTFRTGQDGLLTSMPKLTSQTTDVRNVVHARFGKDLDQFLDPPEAPPAKHPYSQQSMGRRGHDRPLPRWIDLPETKSKNTARVIAHRQLREDLAHPVTVSAECFPFPFLESGDVVRIVSTDFTGNNAAAWKLPLTIGEPMTLGWDFFAYMGAV